MKTVRLRPDVVNALRAWNLEKYGQGVEGPAIMTDPESIAFLEEYAMPGETDLNDTILRLIRDGGPRLPN